MDVGEAVLDEPLQEFGFDPDEPDNPHRLHNHMEDDVVYTGTHDHDTIRGWWESLDPAPLGGRNLGLQGFYLGRLMRHNPDLVREAIGEVVELWSSGAVKPLVGATFPLERAADAHELIEARRHVGKVVLVP